MNIFRLVISFITISYIAIFNVAIASTPEQEPSDVKVQFEQNGSDITLSKEIQSTIIKFNEVSENQTDNLLNSNNEIKAIVKIEDKKESLWKNPAFCAVIGALFAGLVNLFFEIIRQRHAEKMQEERNKFEYEKEYKKTMNNLYAEYVYLCGSHDRVDSSHVSFDEQMKKDLIRVMYQIYAMSDDQKMKMLAYNAIQDFNTDNSTFDNFGELSKAIFSVPKK